MKHIRLFAALLCAAAPFAHAATGGMLNEIVVTATREPQPLNQSLASTTVITAQDIRNSQAPDVPTLLKDVAGVEFAQSGGVGQQGSLFLRGSNSNQVLVLLDGVRINSATTGATAIDQLMLDQIDHIEVVRGNVSSLYGSEAIGGVIQIFTKRGKGRPAFSISGGAGSHDSQRMSAGFGGQSGATNFNLQVSHYRTAGVSAIKPSIVPTVNPDKDGYDNTSFSANVRHAFDADNSLSASVFRSRGNAQYDNAFGLPTDVNNSVTTLGKYSLALNNRLSGMWHSKLQWSAGLDDAKNYLNGLPDLVNGYYITTHNRQLTWQNDLLLNAHNRLLLGTENLRQRVASDTVYTRTERSANSLFGGYTGNFGAHEVQANLRQDHYSDFGAANTWRLGYGYAISEAWRASATLSTAFRAPTFNDLYAPAIWGGNPSLQPERSHDRELGIHYATATQRLDATYFESRITDLITYQYPSNVNLNQVRISGAEVSYLGQFGNNTVKASLTLQNPRDVQTGLQLLRRARSFGNIGISRQMGAWKMGGEWQFSGPRKDIDINTYQRTTLAGYGLVNLTASREFDKHFGLSVRAANLFNRDYMLVHGYNNPGRTVFVSLHYRQ
jgi:vitamin B12 transporter